MGVGGSVVTEICVCVGGDCWYRNMCWGFNGTEIISVGVWVVEGNKGKMCIKIEQEGFLRGENRGGGEEEE